jgi:hypothetical protein
MLALLVLACTDADKDPSAASDDTSGDADTDTDSDTGTDVPVDRGPTTIALDGDPNGLWWDGETLYLADDDNNRILKWTDADGLGLVGDLPAAAEDGAGLGQLVVLGEGTLLVTRFGYGSAGDIVTLDPDGTSTVVPDLDVERRRIGLTVTDEGAIYDGWFVKSGDVQVGSVGEVDLSGAEPEVMGNLGKVVGVLAVGDILYVADQTAGEVLSAPLANLADTSVFASVEYPDLLCAGPGGTLFTGSSEGDVRQLGADGSVSSLVSGYQEVRGVAFDAVNGRLFFADHDGDDADGETNFLQIVPVD